ncbi:interferon alpha-inducible protein 27-like protein 2A [Oryzias melastigma]|uniref:interferon alpha-inducible protein 27-like protein 2A n=1 Tax=Oryzias melastigma TaxID=30732 RepID=UPI000CF827CE|nr:interferon alpha-inducible protein 27-like protein 2A [Oryzias melastigma]
MEDKRKRALLIHTVGTEAQRIFYTLPDTGDSYAAALQALKTFFIPKLTEENKFPQRAQLVGKVVAVAAGAVGAVALAPVALGAIGFTSGGVAAGSFAAGMMSSAAAANGGGVAAGSLVAALQSAGAAGLSTSASAAVAAVGGTVGAGVTSAVGWLRSRFSDQK